MNPSDKEIDSSLAKESSARPATVRDKSLLMDSSTGKKADPKGTGSFDGERAPSSFDKSDYEGSAPSTLCLGCGHDQISKHIIQALWSAGADPFNVAKISGIGCSSKTPNYFLKLARGFNSIHGRMALYRHRR